MRLREYIRPELVVLDLEAQGVGPAIRALVDRLVAGGVKVDAAALAEVLLAREAAHTTAMGNGVAVPHATLPGLTEPLVMVAVAPAGAAFGPVGLDPVRLFFLLLSPPDRTGLHIKLLARIARLVRHPGLVPRLVAAPTAQALLEELERVDAEHV